MSKAWPLVRVGDVLRRSTDVVVISPSAEYREITVKLWGKGVVPRGVISRGSLVGSRRFVAKTGQFILSRIDARNGAMGIVPPALDGALVTNDFPLFDLDPERLDPEYLGWISRTQGFVSLCQRASEGTTNRVRLKEERFLAVELRLPPIIEQRRIVECIDKVARKIVEIRQIHEHIIAESNRLVRGMLHLAKCPEHRVAELVSYRSPDILVHPEAEYQFAGVYSFGRGVFRSQQRMGSEFSYPTLSRLRAGDFVYPKLMAWEGAFGVVPAECEGCVVSPEFPVFEIKRDKILPEIMDVYFKDPQVWAGISGRSTGTNVRRQRLNPKDFVELTLPVPSMHTQEKICQVYKLLQQKQSLRDISARQLDALLRTLLDRVFRGEL